MAQEIPLVYLDIIERFYKNRTGTDFIDLVRAKRILGSLYHFKKANIFGIFREMQDYGLIKCNFAIIIVLWKPDS